MAVIVPVANVTSTTKFAQTSWQRKNAVANRATNGFCECTAFFLRLLSFFSLCDLNRNRLNSGVTCELLEKDLGCSCSSCSCKPPPKCDAKHKKMCGDAFKEPCSGKSPRCGKCIKGYASDGKYGCGAWKNCKLLGKIEEKKGTAESQPVCGRDFLCTYVWHYICMVRKMQLRGAAFSYSDCAIVV